MGAILNPPKPKVQAAPDPLPPAPERSDAETAALAEEQRSRLNKGRGRASNYLTGAGTTTGSAAGRFLGSGAPT